MPESSPGTIQDGQSVADFQVVLGGIVAVDHHVVRALKRAASHEPKSAVELVEFLEIEAGDVIEHVGALQKHAGGGHDVRLLVDHYRYDPGRHTQTEVDYRRAGGPYDDIGADALCAARLLGQHALTDSHQRQHHGHLNADGHDAEQRPDRPVLQVFYNEFVDQPTCRIRSRAAATVSAPASRCARIPRCGTSGRIRRTCRHHQPVWCPASPSRRKHGSEALRGRRWG